MWRVAFLVVVAMAAMCVATRVAAQADSTLRPEEISIGDAAMCPLAALAADDARQLRVRHFVAPAVGLATGTAIAFVPALKGVNPAVRNAMLGFRHDIAMENFFHGVDDVMQFAPVTAVLALKACGVPSRHSMGDIAVRLLMTYGLMAIATKTVKTWTEEPRPYNENVFNSFYSGHTCTAFAGAEMLRLDYGEQSPWIGIGAYAVCSFTGFLRVYNDRHWLGDVLAGAGAGILCAATSSWVCDKMLEWSARRDSLSLSMLPAPHEARYILVDYGG